MIRWIWTGALLLLVVAAGCKKQVQITDQDAIRAGIEKRLSENQGLNLSAMDKEVKEISVNGDHATAQVEFRLKGGDARMEIEYTLERQGGDWKILSSQPIAGQDMHPGMQPPRPAASDDGKQ